MALSTPIPRTVRSTLVENLRDEILSGKLVPGQQLRLEDIAAQFDLSTTPVREALRDLEAEGLVTIFPHRGAVVSELSANDLLDIYDIRATLEEMATRLAIPGVTEKVLTELQSIVQQIDDHMGELVNLVKLNHHFHSTLYEVSNRRHLCDLIIMLRYRTQHYLHAYISHLGGMPHAQTEHREIIDACRSGDCERAAALVHNHVENVGKSIVDYVAGKGETSG